MKARDIIPGWPRGKSTTQPTVPPLTWWESHDGTLYEMVEGFYPSSDRHYHAGQQAMVDRYRQLGPIEPPLFFRHWVDLRVFGISYLLFPIPTVESPRA